MFVYTLFSDTRGVLAVVVARGNLLIPVSMGWERLCFCGVHVDEYGVLWMKRLSLVFSAAQGNGLAHACPALGCN